MPEGITTYCLGVGCMSKCKTCQHERNWGALNQLPNTLRLALQKLAQRIDQCECQITSGCHYLPMKESGE